MQISAVIYARTSPDCPISAEDQAQHLKAIAAEHGWIIANVFLDRPMPTKKGRERRSGEAALITAIRRGGVQKVLMIGIDRVGRSLIELVGVLEACRIADVSLWLDDRKLDSQSSNGLSLFDMAAMMSMRLRQTRRDRILRGQAAARSLNVKFGRPALSVAKVEKAKDFLAVGKGVREAARLAGISAASVSRLRKEIQAGVCAD
jgi:DNA invertase Pin-like site-specific DNA recombinase